MKIKDLYHRFRAWQEQPFQYINKSTHTITCINCGHEVSANYCPICGQRANVGRINWETVRQGVMLLWGMDSRSLFSTLLQLLFRPGHLINDYISGRRQVSFPPVKMLFVVAVMVTLLEFFFGSDNNTQTLAADADLLSRIVNWLSDNLAWTVLGLTSMLLLPTWFVFRHSPLHERHTLPEGFFIQVFMATLFVVFIIFGYIAENILYVVVFYYLAVYHRLFGYGIWGTLWRFLVCFYLVCMELYLVIIVLSIFTGYDERIASRIGLSITVFVTLTLIPVAITYFINRHTARRRQQPAPPADKK